MPVATVERSSVMRHLALLVSIATLAVLFVMYNDASQGLLLWFRFNPYSLLSFIPFVASVIVLVLIIRHPAHSDERTWLGLYLAGVCVWSLTEGLQRLSVTQTGALFWATITGVTIVLMASCFFIFALLYTTRSEVRYTGTIVGVLIIAVLMGFFYGYTDVIFKTTLDAVHAYPWGYNNDSGPGLGAVLAWMDLLYVMSVVRMIRFRRRTSNPILRQQTLIYIIGILFPLTIGSITDGVLPALGINWLPPLAMPAMTIAAILFTFGALHYQLLTINPLQFSETILSIIHEAVVVTDANFNIIYTNAEAETLLGLQGNSAGQRSLLQFLDSKTQVEALQAAYRDPAAATLAPLPHVDINSTNRRKTPVRITSSRLQIEGLSANVMVLADISAELHSKSIIERTVRTRTRELHEARAYLVASINSLDQGFMLVDQTGRVEIANQAATHSLAGAGADMKAPTIMAMAQPMKWDVKLGPAVELVLGRRVSQQMHASAEDGTFYDLYLTPVLAGSKVIGAAILVENVTERRILERSRDEFFSIASHELRTPLTAIRGNASIVHDNFTTARGKRVFSESDMTAMVDDIHTSSIRLIEIVNDFLDTSRLEQGKMVFELRPTDLRPVIDSVRDDFAQTVAGTGTRIVYAGLDDLPPVNVDANRIRQVVYNLLSNAVKYTQGGTVTVRAEVIGKKLRLRFSDTGAGITPENQNLLFHKFQQAGDSLLTRDTSKGTGLGLYISRLLSENMAGSLMLEHSEPGQGSTFLLTLPLAKVARERDVKTVEG